jgi:hypothetical protein
MSIEPEYVYTTGGRKPEPRRWLVVQCSADDAALVYDLGKEGWEPFAVTTAPSAHPSIWWRNQEEAA